MKDLGPIRRKDLFYGVEILVHKDTPLLYSIFLYFDTNSRVILLNLWNSYQH